MGRPSRRDELPLNPQVSLQRFENWAIDFVGPISPLGKTIGAHYLITVIEYLTRWVEAKPTKDCTGATIIKFLFEYVLTMFGCSKVLISDHQTYLRRHRLRPRSRNLLHASVMVRQRWPKFSLKKTWKSWSWNSIHGLPLCWKLGNNVRLLLRMEYLLWIPWFWIAQHCFSRSWK